MLTKIMYNLQNNDLVSEKIYLYNDSKYQSVENILLQIFIICTINNGADFLSAPLYFYFPNNLCISFHVTANIRATINKPNATVI